MPRNFGSKDSGPKAVLDAGSKLFDLAQSAFLMTNVALKRAGHGKPAAIHVGMNFAAGILHSVAVLTADTSSVDPDNPTQEAINRCITPEVLLFTALLVNKCSPEAEGNVVNTEFGPEQIFNALEAYEQLTGKRCDEFLDKDMVAAARKAGTSAQELLQNVLTRPRGSPEQPGSLN